MIVYDNSLKNFKEAVLLNSISDEILESLREKKISGGARSEINSWNNSLHFMKDVLDCPSIPDDCEVAIEYNIPQTSKRVDFMILGSDKNNRDNVVIVELKQWSRVNKIDDVFKHSIMSDLRGNSPVAHPSYQAYSYKSLILNYCDEVNLEKDDLHPCAYLHNLNESYREVIEDDIYSEWTSEAPVFLQRDVLKLRDFIEKYITAKSSDNKLLYKIDYGRIKPQKALQDSIDSMLCGNEEFKLIDEQIVAYDMIMKTIDNARKDNKKHVMIISGGPGTGKSVLAINVLANCISKLSLNASYITKNKTPRDCYTYLLTNGNSKKIVDLKMAIKSPHTLPSTPINGIDVGLFDESHRMQQKPYMYKGDDMLFDAINACKVSIFFIDLDQRVTTKDCYDIKDIEDMAKRQGAILDFDEPYELTSQFRCNGSDSYISFINNLLGISKTANTTISNKDFIFKVFDNPNELRDELRKINKVNNKARMVAGYCYDWNVKNKRGDWDVIIGDEFKAKWNLEKDAIFAINKNSFEQVGCIHTVQGMEFDYVGVFIGKDLYYDGSSVKTNKYAISKDDHSSGIRGCKNEELADRLIRNTYKVLLTRGQKGCFVYCEDKALNEYIKKHILVKND
ncbi:MAG: DUF2075 domain-containing protein [Erysipelotrichaceae bacterium]|nr:DUF2075 domain-containing protein [Erysipelotrichaceae bacterium]